MKYISTLLAGLGLASVTSAASVQGFDVSNYQPNVDMKAAYNGGARFVIIKASS